MDFGAKTCTFFSDTSTAWVCWMTPKETKPRKYLRALRRTETLRDDCFVCFVCFGRMVFILTWIDVGLLVWFHNCIYIYTHCFPTIDISEYLCMLFYDYTCLLTSYGFFDLHGFGGPQLDLLTRQRSSTDFLFVADVIFEATKNQI